MSRWQHCYGHPCQASAYQLFIYLYDSDLFTSSFYVAAIFTMDSKLEQRTCIKFCCKNEITCSDTLKMLQKCYGDDTLSKTQVYQWYERFKSGREAVEDDARPGRPSTSKTDENVDEIRQLLIENRKLTIREIAETTNISFGSVQSILRKDLGLRRVTARLVPKELNFVR